MKYSFGMCWCLAAQRRLCAGCSSPPQYRAAGAAAATLPGSKVAVSGDTGHECGSADGPFLACEAAGPCRCRRITTAPGAHLAASVITGSRARSKIGFGCWPAVSSLRQAARQYSLINPLSTGFRWIRSMSRFTAVTPGTSRSQPGTRWAMP